MGGLEGDTVGGFNAMLQRQRELKGQVWVSTVLFNNVTSVLHDRLPLEQVKELTLNDYRVGGCTALMDAIGGAIKHIGNIHKYARKEDVPQKTLFVITTDGMENASRQYNAETVRRMIRRQEEEFGWEFLFVAANIDAVETAGYIGIAPERAANYRPTPKGTRRLYDTLGETLCNLRCAVPLAEDWADSLNDETED